MRNQQEGVVGWLGLHVVGGTVLRVTEVLTRMLGRVLDC